MSREEIDQYLKGVMAADEQTSMSCINRLGDILEFQTLIFDDIEYIAETLIECIIQRRNNKLRLEMFNVLEKTFRKEFIAPDVDKLVNCFDHEDEAFIANTLLIFPLRGKKSYIPIAEKFLDHPNSFIAKNAAYALKYLKN